VIYFRKLITGAVEECQPGMIFDVKDGCVEGASASCIETPPNREEQSDSEVAIVPKLDLDAICFGKNLAFVPHPTDCALFIVCQFQVGDIRQCPDHSPVFDSSRLICVAGKSIY
jgi:hypothetical protein